MVLKEQVRVLANEENLVKDTTTYTQEAVADWTTKATKNITLSATKKVLVRFTFDLHNTVGANKWVRGGGRVLLDGVILLATGYYNVELTPTQTQSHEREIYITLAAGSYSLAFQLSLVFQTDASAYVRMRNIQIGVVDFTDTNFDDVESGDTVVANGATVQVLSQDFTLPSNRKMAIGTLNNVLAMAIVAVVCEGYAGSKLKNVGDGDDALLNWKLYLDGVQVSWTERIDDYQVVDNTKCEGAYGRYENISLEKGSDHTIRIDCYNNSGAQKTVRARLAVIQSPWILPSLDNFQPVTLSFAEESTFYVTLEPLSRNSTKTFKIGKVRAYSINDDNDFFYTNSGIDRLPCNYTFELYKVVGAIVIVTGLGGCITTIGVDMR